jgi:hypothetical protein
MARVVTEPQYFTWISDVSHCCLATRGKHRLQINRTTECASLEACLSRCAADPRCSHASHSTDYGGLCAACDGCELSPGPWSHGHGQLLGLYTTWARSSLNSSTEELVADADAALLVEAEKQWVASGCRGDLDASGASHGHKCTYKVEPDAVLSDGGPAHEYYHFMVDFVPRIFYAMHRDACTQARLFLPGHWPNHRSFALRASSGATDSYGWGVIYEQEPVRALASSLLQHRGMVAQALSLFGAGSLFGHRLNVSFVEGRAALCAQPGRRIPFAPGLFSWGAQPAKWLQNFRSLAWVCIAPVA